MRQPRLKALARRTAPPVRHEERARDKVHWRRGGAKATAARTTISAVTRRRRDCSPGDACSAYSGSQIAVIVSKLIGSPNSWIPPPPPGQNRAKRRLWGGGGPAPASTKWSTNSSESPERLTARKL